jgi:hypothetical protein
MFIGEKSLFQSYFLISDLSLFIYLFLCLNERFRNVKFNILAYNVLQTFVKLRHKKNDLCGV